MAFKVQVGPAQIAIHQGQSVLLTEPDGCGRELAQQSRAVFPRHQGDQRLGDLCQRRILEPVERRRHRPSCGAHLPDQSRVREARTVRSQRARWAWVIGRHIEGGLHEDFDITNNSQHPVRFNLEIA